MMSTIFTFTEATLPCAPNASMLGKRNPELPEPLPADAEEEEFVELWAADPGNQGA